MNKNMLQPGDLDIQQEAISLKEATFLFALTGRSLQDVPAPTSDMFDRPQELVGTTAQQIMALNSPLAWHDALRRKHNQSDLEEASRVAQENARAVEAFARISLTGMLLGRRNMQAVLENNPDSCLVAATFETLQDEEPARNFFDFQQRMVTMFGNVQQKGKLIAELHQTGFEDIERLDLFENLLRMLGARTELISSERQ